jgi:hypothetical protein
MELFPHSQTMPKTSSADAAIQAALQLTHALQNPAPAAPFAQIGHEQITALQQLAAIFTTSANGTAKDPTSDPATLPRVAAVSPASQNHAPPPRVVATVPAPIQQPAQTAPPDKPPAPTPHIIPPDDNQPPIALHQLDNEPVRIQPGTFNARAPAAPTVRHTIPVSTPISNNTRNREARRPSYQYANAVIDEVTGKSCEYRHLVTGNVNGHNKEEWETSFANELGRLANGIGTRMPTGTNTIAFIKKADVPADRAPTYGRIVVSVRPQKAEKYRTRLTVGGNLINYPFEVSTPTADLTTAKLLLNSIISTPNAKFLVTDIKDFYLNTKMERYEYMRLPVNVIPAEIMVQYNLQALIHKEYIYIEIRKGMYGLPQAGKLANQQLTTHLAKYGYKPTEHTPGLWRHD